MHPRGMELSLETDGALAALRVRGSVGMGETTALTEYLRVARENGAVRCVLDFSGCSELPTTIVPVLLREAAKLAEAGGVLALSGVTTQNPFLTEAVVEGRFAHYPSVEEAIGSERARSAIDAPGPVT